MNPSMYLYLFLALVACGKVLAKEEVLATITNDENKEVYTFVVNSDDTNSGIKAFFKDDYLNGKKIERELLPTKDLTKEGVVLEKRGDHTVINLKSENFDYVRGGVVTIDTLYNGVNGERKEYDLHLAKSESGWKLFRGNAPVSKLHIEVNKKMIIGTVGVKNIIMK